MRLQPGVALLLVAAAGMCGCRSRTMVGIWKADVASMRMGDPGYDRNSDRAFAGAIIRLYSDGTCESFMSGALLKGTYSVQGDVVSFKYNMLGQELLLASRMSADKKTLSRPGNPLSLYDSHGVYRAP